MDVVRIPLAIQIYNKVHGFVSVNFFVRDACGNETFMGNADFGERPCPP